VALPRLGLTKMNLPWATGEAPSRWSTRTDTWTSTSAPAAREPRPSSSRSQRTSSKERKERSRGTKAEDLKRLVNNYSWDWVWIYWYITFLLFLLIITGIIQASLRLWTERRIERVLGQQNICSPSDVSKCQAQDVDLITLVTRMRSFVFCLQITKLQP